jgi:hypothetical protein
MVVQQVGAAVTGWEVDPDKPIAPWTPSSPAELAIFSRQALVQAMHADLGVDRSLVWGGEYVSLLLETDGKKAGFAETPIGQKVRATGSHWRKRLAGNPEFRFRLCLAPAPFAEGPFMDAIVVLSPAIIEKS